MKKYICTVCEYIYDPAQGDPESGIEPGTAFETFRMIGLVHFAESEKRTLNRTKDKKIKREKRLLKK